MTQKAIARECAEWIKNKVKIRTLKQTISTIMKNTIILR